MEANTSEASAVPRPRRVPRDAGGATGCAPVGADVVACPETAGLAAGDDTADDDDAGDTARDAGFAPTTCGDWWGE